MNKTNLEPFAVDNLFGRPGNWNSRTPRGHDNNVPIRAALEKVNVAIVRENPRPQFQVRGGLEDVSLRRVHKDGVGFLHLPMSFEQIET